MAAPQKPHLPIAAFAVILVGKKSV